MQLTAHTPTRTLATLLGVAGLLVLALTFAFGRLPAVQAAGDCWNPDAVFLFEFATSQDELRDIFGDAGGRCRALTVKAMDAANTLDVFTYIPAYTAFTCLAALYIACGARRLRAIAIALALIAAAADYIETSTLLAMTKDLAFATDAQMLTASTAAWIKFACLAAHAAVLSVACFLAMPRRLVLGALLATPLIGFLAMLFRFDLYAMLKLGFFAAWTPLLIVGLRDAILPAFASAQSSPQHEHLPS